MSGSQVTRTYIKLCGQRVCYNKPTYIHDTQITPTRTHTYILQTIPKTEPVYTSKASTSSAMIYHVLHCGMRFSEHVLQNRKHVDPHGSDYWIWVHSIYIYVYRHAYIHICIERYVHMYLYTYIPTYTARWCHPDGGRTLLIIHCSLHESSLSTSTYTILQAPASTIYTDESTFFPWSCQPPKPSQCRHQHI